MRIKSLFAIAFGAFSKTKLLFREGARVLSINGPSVALNMLGDAFCEIARAGTTREPTHASR